jgi:phosphatidylserine/phosphatidylglycerophosphate/cardiolipin synthase-like enzyme
MKISKGKIALICFVLALVGGIFGYGIYLGKQWSKSEAKVQIYFSPRGGCTKAIVNELDNAEKTILVQAFSFTSVPIAQALVNAHKRGVKVQVLLDESNEGAQYTSATFLQHNGLLPFIDHDNAIAHNKIIVIDGVKVITGSFNFSKAAEESNAENLLIINDPVIAQDYTSNWEKHFSNARQYVRKEKK